MSTGGQRKLGERSRMGLEINALKEIEELKIDAGGTAAGGETSSGGDSTAISLIELAEILDQHKIWAESGGESGAKADLTGVNLAKADLTGVNLQGAHLHRMNLAGADLSMANLRGASLVRSNLQNSNLLGTELRGANLMGANLYGAEGLWFGRLGGTNLFDSVLPESISAVDSSKAIGDATKVARWFYFLTMGLSAVCSLLIAFTSDVRLLVNSSALHTTRLATLLHVFLMTLSVATATCVPFVVSRVLRPGDIRIPKSKNILRMILGTTRAALATGFILFVISLGVNRGLPADRNASAGESPSDPRRWAALVFQSVGYRPYADLTEAALSTPPPRGAVWDDETVEGIAGAHLNQMNLRFARGYRAFLINAKLWRANLEGAYLSEADLRGANLREALLRSAILDRVQLTHAVLVSANATGTNLSASDLRFADLSYGTFENAVLSNAKVSGASLYAVNLRNAQMLRTDLSRTDMRDTKLEHAVLSFANLEQADLSSAKLGDANLTGARLKGTILLDADLRRADLRGAYLTGAVLREAEMDGANLAGADLRGASGITSQQVCSALHGRSALMDADLATDVQLRCGSAQ